MIIIRIRDHAIKLVRKYEKAKKKNWALFEIICQAFGRTVLFFSFFPETELTDCSYHAFTGIDISLSYKMHLEKGLSWPLVL